VRHLTAVWITTKDGVTGWHYASLSRRGGHPLGGCATHEPHPSEIEARECYAAWQRERIRLDGKCDWTSCEAYGCDSPTRHVARIEGDGYRMACLCPEHLTVENAIHALHLSGAAGDSWQS
jgi:hypothetical protein